MEVIVRIISVTRNKKCLTLAPGSDKTFKFQRCLAWESVIRSCLVGEVLKIWYLDRLLFCVLLAKDIQNLVSKIPPLRAFHTRLQTFNMKNLI